MCFIYCCWIYFSSWVSRLLSQKLRCVFMYQHEFTTWGQERVTALPVLHSKQLRSTFVNLLSSCFILPKTSYCLIMQWTSSICLMQFQSKCLQQRFKKKSLTFHREKNIFTRVSRFLLGLLTKPTIELAKLFIHKQDTLCMMSFQNEINIWSYKRTALRTMCFFSKILNSWKYIA